MCYKLLPWPPPHGWKPGFTTGERFCDCCAPRVVIHIQQGVPWSAQFSNVPWLLFATSAEVNAVLTWAHADVSTYAHDIQQWGRTSMEARLTEQQRYQLARRRKGWPWNGYELLKMWHAGKYPPDRLTPYQERIFLRNREP